MSTKLPIRLPALPKVHWIAYINIAVAMVLGIWLPLRMVFLDEPVQFDLLVDLLALVVVLAGRKERYSPARNRDSMFNRVLAMTSDVLVALPAVTLISVFTNYEASEWFFVLKLLFLPRVFEIRGVLDNFDSLHPVIYRLLPVALVMPVVIHIVACGWIWMGSGSAGGEPDKLLAYAKGVYWAITTLATVGYGDIVPKTLPQMFYANAVMMVGVAFFGYILSNVASFLARLDAAREEYLSKLDQVETFIGYNELPPHLRTKIRSYYRYMWDQGMGNDDSAVLNKLPQKLRAEVSLFLHEEMIEKVPILSEASRECLEDIVLQLRPRVVVPGEYIFHAGEEGDAMFFIHRGRVEILSREGQLLATLPAGAFFGEMALLTRNPRNASVRAAEYCDLYEFSRASFERVLSRYPAFEKHVKEIAEQRVQGAVPVPAR